MMGIFAQADRNSLMAGAVLMVIGELVRVHGVAFIGGVSRTRTFSTGQKVITGGPFARVRNPLYVGNLLLSTGLVVSSNVNMGLTPYDAIYFTAFFVLFFFLQYIPIVKWEESNLKKVFGKEFEDYLKSVPPWIPKLFVQASGPQIKGDYGKAIKSEKNTLRATVTIMVLVLWRSGYFQM